MYDRGMDTRTPSDDVEFSRTTRGYDPAEVDRFVASVRSELTDLQDKLRRLENSPGRGGNRRDGGKLHDPDRAVERMLAAAQQTADRVVFDAEAEADRLVSEAEVEAERLVTDAQSQSRHRMAEVEAQGEKIRREAVTEARRVVEETRQPLAREVRKLRTTRDGLRAEIEMLKRFLSDHRGRVRAIGDSLRSMADDPAALRVDKLPEPTPIDVDVSDDFEIDVAAAPPKAASAPAPVTAPAAAPAAAAKVAAPSSPAPAAASSVVIDDTLDDDGDAMDDAGVGDVEWGDSEAETDDEVSYGGADTEEADVDETDDDDDGNVISGAFASVISDEPEASDGGTDRFRDAIQKANSDDDFDLGSSASDSASGFFESQIDDPS